MDKNIHPAGWNNERVRKVIDDIEVRTEEETIAEDEAALDLDTLGFSFSLRFFDPSTFRPFDKLRDHKLKAPQAQGPPREGKRRTEILPSVGSFRVDKGTRCLYWKLTMVSEDWSDGE